MCSIYENPKRNEKIKLFHEMQPIERVEEMIFSKQSQSREFYTIM